MAEVPWIKLMTDIFDNKKIKYLRRLPEGNNIVLMWLMLLTMAGKCNDGGEVFLTEEIPYSPQMLADELDFPETTVCLALKAMEQLHMIELSDGFLNIPGWAEHQNTESLDRIREQKRKAQQRWREKKKAQNAGLPPPVVDSTVDSTRHNVDGTEEEEEKEREEDKEQEEDLDSSLSIDDDDSAESAESIVDEFARLNGLTQRAYDLFNTCPAKTREKVSDTTAILFQKSVGTKPTEMDEAKVYSWTVDENQKVSNQKIYILTCAFYRASESGHRGQWSYIEGILADMNAKGVKTKDDVARYFQSRKDDG